MSADYISMMTDDELLYVCHAITGRFLKQYYTKHAAVFQRIAPGRYIKKLSEEDACLLTVRNKRDSSIEKQLNGQIAEWLQQIKEARDGQEKEGESVESALVKTMPDSFFATNLPLYFKLNEEEHSPEFIRLLSCAVKQVIAERKLIPGDDAPYHDAEESAHVRELEEENEKIRQSIDTLSHEHAEMVAALEQRINESSNLVDTFSKEKSVLEKELKKYQELAKHKVVTEEYLPLDDYTYMSLCEAISDDNGAPRLRRCADYVDGAFTTVFYDEPQRWRLFRKNGIVSDGHWGVWDWKTIPRENGGTYIESNLDPRIEPIGVVAVQNCHSTAEIVDALKIGIEITSCFSAILLGYYSGSVFEGVYCNKSELSCLGTKYSVPSSINLLPVFEIMKDDILAIQDDVQIVRFLNLGMPVRTVSVRAPMEIVKEHVLSRVTWAVMKQKGFSRNDFQKTKDYLEQFQTDDIKEAIAASCNCSVEDADALLNEFIAKAASVIDGTTLENDVMVQVIRNNAQLYAQYMESLRTEWEEQNQKQLSEANDALDLARKNKAVEEIKVKELKGEQKELAHEITKRKEEIAAQEQLAEDVKTKVLEKIESARKDAASFIAENAFLQPMQQQDKAMPVSVSTMQRYFSGEEASTDDKEVSTNWEELIETLSYGLEKAGVSHSVSLGLSALMYSACLKRVPLLLAGPNGRDIADAFSLGLFGKRPGKLVCNGEFDSTAIERLLNSDDTVIVIEQPFDAAWYAHVLTLFAQREKFLIALNPFVEDLLVEPTSLWNYCVPVITEMIVTKPSTGQYISGSITDTFEVFKSSLDIKRFKAASFMNLRPMVNYNIQAIGSDMVEMCDGQNSGCEFPLLVYPLAYLTGKLDMFNERIQSGQVTLSSEIKTLMSPFLGDEE